MDEKVRDTVEQLNSMLGDMPYKLDMVDPKKIKLLDKNARYMSHEMFENLVKNVRRDGALTSLPLCHRHDGAMTVLSGNHRVQAAVHANIEKILVLVIDRELTRQELVSIQLSHNAIEGKDDPVILKELWSEIEDIDLKLYAGLDTELVNELENMEFVTISETSPDFKSIVFAFLPEEVDQIKTVMEDVDMLFSKDENFILSRKHYEEVFNVLVDVKDQYGIVNNPTAFMKIIEMAKGYMEDHPIEEPEAVAVE